MKPDKRLFAAMAMIAVIAILGCRNDSDPRPPVPQPAWGIELDAPATHTFPALTHGYTAAARQPLTVAVTNTGNQPTGALVVALSGANPGAFAVTGSPIASIAVGGTPATFTVVPNTGLAVGTHAATVTVTGDNDISESFEVLFQVTAQAPPAPTGVNVTPAAATVDQGQTQQFSAAVVPAGAVQAVTWSVEPPAAGTISATGLLTLSATATGTVTVRATATGTTVSGTATVTVRIPAWGIELDAPATHVFDALTEGYTAAARQPLTVAVTNTGNQPTGALTVALSGTHSDAFTVTGSPIASIVVGGTPATFTVTPNTGLAVGTHTATVTVSGGNEISATFAVSFTVNAAEPTPAWGIELDAPATHVFDALTEGYTADDMEALAVIVTNTGNQPTGALTVALSGTHSDAFTVTGSPIASIAVGGTPATFTVTPNTGLAVGTHTATVTVSGGNDISATFNVSFTVNEQPPATGEGDFTIRLQDFYAMEPITIPNISLSDPGRARRVSLDNPGQYDADSIAWFHLGAPVSAAAVSGDYGETLDLDMVHGDRTGTQSVTVEVRRGGALYSQIVHFTVTN